MLILGVKLVAPAQGWLMKCRLPSEDVVNAVIPSPSPGEGRDEGDLKTIRYIAPLSPESVERALYTKPF